MTFRAALAMAITLAMMLLGACGATEPVREQSPREARLQSLDSLVRAHPCSSVHATVLADPSVFTQRQACAVAARALELLGAAQQREPYMAPADTARVAVIRIQRWRLCTFSVDPGAVPPGRMDSLSYVAEMDVPSRPHFLVAGMNAHTFAGGASYDEHPRNLWRGPFLTQPIESPDTLEAGAPCG